MDDLALASPAQARYGGQGLLMSMIQSVKKPGECLFTLTSDHIVNVRLSQCRFRTDGRKVSTPDDRCSRRTGTNLFRAGDGCCQLWFFFVFVFVGLFVFFVSCSFCGCFV